MRRSAIAMLACLLSPWAVAQSPPADLTLSEVYPAATFNAPLGVRNADDGSNRLFIVERGGSIRVRKNGAILPTALVTITVPTSSERGLLGLAFHPNYDGVNERRFYLSYTSSAVGNPHTVGEFQTAVGNPDVAASNTPRTVITVPDFAGNHNGGDLAFGPDGYLYWSIGDGGDQNDPNGFAQCLWKKPRDGLTPCAPGAGTNYWLLGKILRIDPTTTTPSATAEMCGATAGQPAGYSIPPTNPYVGTTNTCDEIVHFGMRNPWRFSFDRTTGDLYVADVGQGSWEETTLIPAGQLGQNLGWRCFEGVTPFAGGCSPVPTNVQPFMTYAHASSRCSISGGIRYRGPIVGLRSTYISGDACTGEVFFATNNAGNWSPAQGTVAVFNNNNPTFGFYGLVGFGEDEQGNVYAPSMSTGALYVFSSATGGDQLFANGFE